MIILGVTQSACFNAHHIARTLREIVQGWGKWPRISEAGQRPKAFTRCQLYLLFLLYGLSSIVGRGGDRHHVPAPLADYHVLNIPGEIGGASAPG
jgi:hypothetical protein